MSAKFHLVDSAAVIERQQNRLSNAKEMAVHLSVAQIMASLAWVEHHSEKLRVVAAENSSSTLGPDTQQFGSKVVANAILLPLHSRLFHSVG